MDFDGNSLKISGRVDLLWVDKISEKSKLAFSVQSPFSVRIAIFDPFFDLKNSPKFEIEPNPSETCHKYTL